MQVVLTYHKKVELWLLVAGPSAVETVSSPRNCNYSKPYRGSGGLEAIEYKQVDLRNVRGEIK